MDQRLINWGRAVKRGPVPVLWLFTDSARMPDILGAIAALPPGLCGVVFRHDAEPERVILGLEIAKLCRARRLALVVAGDPRLAAQLHAGLHLRGGRHAGYIRPPANRLVTSSVHNILELRRARRAGANILFISPVYQTSSHPGAAGLGSCGWLRMARLATPAMPYALGGIDGKSIRGLGRICAGAGAIEALLGYKNGGFKQNPGDARGLKC